MKKVWEWLNEDVGTSLNEWLIFMVVALAGYAAIGLLR